MKTREKERASLDEWQYRIFKWVLFIFFLVSIYKLLDVELHIGQFLAGMLGN